MSDLATLGFVVQTSGLSKGERALNKYATTGAKTEKKVKNNVTGMNKSFLSLATSIGLVSTAMATIGIGLATKSVLSLETSLAGLEAVTSATALQMQALEEQARSLGATSRFSATQAAQAQRFLAMSGFNVNEVLKASPSILKLAAVATLDLATSADIATNVLKGMNLPVQDLSRVVDVMALASSSANTDVRQLGEALSYAAPLAAGAGVSIEETAALIGVLSDAGIQASRAGTGVVGIIRQLSNPTTEATETLAKYGVTTKEVSVSTLGLAKVLDTLGKASISAPDALKIFGTIAGPSGLVAAKAAGHFAELTTELNNSNGAAGKMADTMNQTTTAAALGLASAVNELSLQFTKDSGLNDSTRDLIALATGVTHAFTGMLPEFAEANDLGNDFVNTVNAIVAAGEGFVSVIGVGMAGSIMKSAIASTSDVVAKMAQSKAILAGAKAAEVNTLAELNLIKIQQKSLASSLALAQTERTRTAIRSQLASNTVRLSTANAIYAKTQQSVAIATTEATLATRALGVATKLLLGPWGLIGGAIAIALTSFSTARNDSENLEEALRSQGERVDELTDKYKKMSNQAIGSAYVSAQQTLIGYDQQRLDLNQQMAELSGKMDPVSASKYTLLAQELIKVNAASKGPEERLKSIQEIFEDGLNAIEWTDGLSEVEGGVDGVSNELTEAQRQFAFWKETIEGFETPSQKLVSELAKIKDGLSAGTLTATGGLLSYVEKLNEQLDALNEKKVINPFADWVTDEASKPGSGEDTSLQSMIESLTSGTKIAQLDSLQEKIYKIQDLVGMGLMPPDIGEEAINNATSAMEELRDVAEEVNFDNATDSLITGLTSLRSMASEGSSAYQTLSVASDAYAAYQAINAVLNQSGGDPYTAFGRMAAMAAAVASLGQSVGGMSSVSGDDSAEKQATQGTDAWGNDYSSIVDATENTADATEDLVGINTNMLDALTSLQSGITGAAAISAGSIAGIDYDDYFDTSNFLTKANDFSAKMTKAVIDPFNLTGGLIDSAFGWVSKALGGSSKVTDEGIKIMGGTLTDLISGASVYAYETVKSKKGFWSSSKKKTYTSELDEASAQFSLVFESLYDSVFEAGSTLGLSSDYLNNALDSFVIHDASISLKGLDADASTAEIEAVFSRIFNTLSVSIVPFISDFQDAGEELGTTLVRLATEVSLLKYSSNSLGFSLGDLTNDSYALTSAADALASYFGDTEGFSDNISNFLSNFADDSVMLELYSTAMTDSLNEVGLALPNSADAMWNLMSSLDASTDSGLAQIATLLELSDTASEYYDLLEDTQSEMADLSDTFASAVASIYDVTDATAQMSLDNALAAARMGDFSLAESLDVSDYTLDTADFISLSDYNIEQAKSANKLMEIAELSANEAGDVETEQLDELRAINASIMSSLAQTNALLTANNRVAIDTNDYLDTINNKTSYAA